MHKTQRRLRVCEIRRRNDYTWSRCKVLIPCENPSAAPVRTVHYNLRPSGRASSLPQELASCARTTLSVGVNR